MSQLHSNENAQKFLDRADSLHNESRTAVSRDAALAKALEAADILMQALKVTVEPASKKTITAKVKLFLANAEQIKDDPTWKPSTLIPPRVAAGSAAVGSSRTRVLKEPLSTRSLATAEQIIVLRASQLNGFKFPPWRGSPKASEFELRPGEHPFLDEPDLSLSAAQLKGFDGWKRPDEAFPPPSLRENQGEAQPPTMYASSEIDLVQDAATDCSFVASMCAGTARARRGHATLLRTVVHPYDSESSRPRLAPNGKYIFRFNFNGTYRRVEIDDRIPVSTTMRVIHVFDRKNPSLMWPALVEKAYLKVRGGYDFPGSNSGTDLWIICGWIPEQVFLSSEDTSPYDVWRRIFNAHAYGDVLITLGTGKMSKRAERAIGLAGEHDYAVIDLREVDGQKLMLVKNPWCEGTSWRGKTAAQQNARHTNAATTPFDDEDVVPSSRDLLNADDQLSPGTFWVDLNSVTQHFESIYLNWNPGLFTYRQDIHFSWDLTQLSYPSGIVSNPQFTITAKQGGLAWLLLSRHFQTASSEERQSKANLNQQPEYIGLCVYDSHGSQVLISELPFARSPWVDSPQILLRLDNLTPGRAYTVVVGQADLPTLVQTFTMCVFANSAIELEKASDKLPNKDEISGSWAADTAGGSAHSPLYSQNPQFSIATSGSTPVSILLETTDASLAVHVKLVHGRGERVQSIRSRDIIVDSKEHRRGCALAELPSLDAGTYTIVCNTFEPGQEGKFRLRVFSELPTRLALIGREGAGRIRMPLPPAVFRGDENSIAAQLTPTRLTKLAISMKHRNFETSSPVISSSGTRHRQARSMVRISIEHGKQPHRRVLSNSSDGEFGDPIGGLRTPETDVGPSMARDLGLWLVVERNFTPRDLAEEVFSMEAFIEAPHAVEVGEWIEWYD